MKPVLDLPQPDPLNATLSCRVLRPVTPAAPVIYASPHSGAYYPTAMQSLLKVPLLDLRRTEDAFVDELFQQAASHGATMIAANYARCYVDVNRDVRELDETMFADGAPRTSGVPSQRVRAGLGCLPRVGASGQHIYGAPLSRQAGAERLDHVYDGYHRALIGALDELKQTWADIALIDCHSMPSVQPGRSGLPDVVLGDRFGSSCTGKLTSRVERAFRSRGLSVTRNAPYAGGYTTRRYGRPRRGVHVLQIELNRALYMDERAVEKTAGFEPLRQVLAEIIAEIAAFMTAKNA